MVTGRGASTPGGVSEHGPGRQHDRAVAGQGRATGRWIGPGVRNRVAVRDRVMMRGGCTGGHGQQDRQ